MKISAIFAISENNVIGKDNGLPWYLPADLKYFKKITLHHPIIMGRKSYEAIGRPLPQRTNIVVSRNPDYTAEGIVITRSLQEAILAARELKKEEVFIIGGSNLYLSALPLCDKMYVTRVHAEVEGDTFLEDIDPGEWNLISEEKHPADEKNIYDYTFSVYERI